MNSWVKTRSGDAVALLKAPASQLPSQLRSQPRSQPRVFFIFLAAFPYCIRKVENENGAAGPSSSGLGDGPMRMLRRRLSFDGESGERKGKAKHALWTFARNSFLKKMIRLARKIP